ncbi:YgjV family protein [Desulfogranum japonicum]|uniref:YgjV family protein n=1 Tax=Desulfogranum japonicum TaxID=231447 RepID=UPI0004201B95|nr:YgjV family protein [Desulfogranum japonicum]
MTAFFASQLLVGLAICTDLLSFQFKERERVLFCLVISCVLVSFHFMLLGHWTAACLGLLGCVRFTVCCFTTSTRFMLLFLVVSLGISLLTWAGTLSLLSTAAVACNTIGAFCGNDRRLREVMFAGTLLWLIHNCLAGSPTAVLLETIFISSNIIGYYRYYLRKPEYTIA